MRYSKQSKNLWEVFAVVRTALNTSVAKAASHITRVMIKIRAFLLTQDIFSCMTLISLRLSKISGLVKL